MATTEWGGRVGFLGFFGIQIYLLVQKGQTIGKRMVGIRIVDYNDGTFLGAGRILGMRGVLPGIIAGIPYVGWLFALVDVLFIFGEERRCIHDHMAGSKVVIGDAEGTTAGVSDTTRAVQNEASASSSFSSPASVQSAGDSGHTEYSSPGPTRSDPSPEGAPSIDRLRQVLQALEALRDDGSITEKKFRQSRRKALADLVEASDAAPDALLAGLRQLREEGHLRAADVQIVKSIL